MMMPRSAVCCFIMGISMIATHADAPVAQNIRGNWCKKNEWYDAARAQAANIDPLVQSIAGMHTMVQEHAQQARDAAASCYVPLGVTTPSASLTLLGEINLELEEHIKDRSAVLLEQGSDSEDIASDPHIIQDRALGDRVREAQQLMGQVGGVEGIVHDFAARFDEVVARAQSSEKQANTMLAAIPAMLDHRAAENSFYEIKAQVDTLRSYQDYLGGSYQQAFGALIDSLHERAATIATLASALEDHGIYVKDRDARKAADKEREERERVEALQAVREQPVKEKTWWERVISSVQHWWEGGKSKK